MDDDLILAEIEAKHDILLEYSRIMEESISYINKDMYIEMDKFDRVYIDAYEKR